MGLFKKWLMGGHNQLKKQNSRKKNNVNKKKQAGLTTYMLVVNSMRGTVLRLGTNRGKQRDILLDPGDSRHLHPLWRLVTHILNLQHK